MNKLITGMYPFVTKRPDPYTNVLIKFKQLFNSPFALFLQNVKYKTRWAVVHYKMIEVNAVHHTYATGGHMLGTL